MINSLIRELQIRKNELQNTPIETIYFGGGTPSVLSVDEIQLLMNAVYDTYPVIENPEVTLEANPDDLTEEKISAFSMSPINRLSIGVQSFFEKDLILMNRAHNSQEAKNCLSIATQYFKNISVDLIYGIPNCTNQEWLENRNEARYVETQEHGQKIDGKNMMHCRRLLEMAREIGEGKGIIVRRPNREELISIRKGEVDLQSLIDRAENDIVEIDELYKNSNLFAIA